MKTLLCLLVVSCLFVGPGSPVLARTIDVHISGGPGTGNLVVLRVVDYVGEVVLVRTIQVCTSYSFQIDSDLPLFFQVYNDYPWVPLYYGWHYASGDVTFEPPLPPLDGYCGDGRIANAEVCETNGNDGCDPHSFAPVCIRCQFCGCTSDTHCPQASPAWGPCGYGRCASEERPYFTRNCAANRCVLSFQCYYDEVCATKDCGADHGSQQQCAGVCTGANESCYYGQATGCWSCLTPEQVVDPCETPAQENCTLDPALIGLACLAGTEFDVAELRDQFALDEISTAESELLLDLLRLRLSPTYLSMLKDTTGVPVLEWPPDIEESAWWNAYRGSLHAYRVTGEYTQIPGTNPYAGRMCQIAVPEAGDPDPMFMAGDVAFYLVTRVFAGEESGLGFSSDESERLITFPCP